MKADYAYRFLKRLFDLLASGAALVALIPLWLVAILGIELSDPGPVFYLADRVGKDDRHFRMFKFRSMRVDKNEDERSLRPNYSRIFPFGGFMRDTKIDELPQLVNVFLGDMSGGEDGEPRLQPGHGYAPQPRQHHQAPGQLLPVSGQGPGAPLDRV